MKKKNLFEKKLFLNFQKFVIDSIRTKGKNLEQRTMQFFCKSRKKKGSENPEGLQIESNAAISPSNRIETFFHSFPLFYCIHQSTPN